MKEVSDVTFLVIDKGLFLPFARRLATQAKRVIWFNPEIRQFPSVHQGAIGDGFERLEHTKDMWKVMRDVDCVCHPDIGNAGLQLQLEQMGVPVWGGRDADQLELNREFFLRVLQKLGLKVPKHKTVTGVSELRFVLSNDENKFVKISRWRGDFETFHWRTWRMDQGALAQWCVQFGPLAEHITFLVFDDIPCESELGGDTYNVDGYWSQTMLNGREFKDTTYLGAVTKLDQMPQEIQEILHAFSPFLRQRRYRQQWSMEVRDGHFTDATVRGGQPSSASQQLCWTNFPEIVWAGANGELIEPKPASKFTIECAVTAKQKEDGWTIVEMDKGLDESVRFSNCCFVDGCYAFPPNPEMGGILGWLCALGDTPTEALEQAKGLCDALPDGLDANVENLVSLVKEIEESQEQGIPFTKAPLPQPAEIVGD